MPYAEVNGQRIYYQDTRRRRSADRAGPRLPDGPVDVRPADRGARRATTASSPGTSGASGRPSSTRSRSRTGTRPTTASPCSTTSSSTGPCVGGMSQGGFIALRAALQAPERVRALILLGTSVRRLEDPGERRPCTRGCRRLGRRTARVDELANDRRRHHHRPPGGERAVDRQVEGPAEGADPRTGAHCCSSATTSPTASARSTLPGDRHPRHRGHGDPDGAMPRQLADGLSGAGPVVKVPGAHAANLTHPEAVNAAICDVPRQAVRRDPGRRVEGLARDRSRRRPRVR